MAAPLLRGFCFALGDTAGGALIDSSLQGSCLFGIARPPEAACPFSARFGEMKLWVRCVAESGTILNDKVFCSSERKGKQKWPTIAAP